MTTTLIEPVLKSNGERAANVDELHNQGVQLAREGKFGEAIELFKKANAATPRTDIMRNLAQAYVDSHRGDDAEVTYAAIVELDRNAADAWQQLGACRRRFKRCLGALEAFEKAVELAPDSPEYHHDKGLALAELKRNSEAQACYLKAIELRPDFPEAFNNLGVLCQEMDRIDEAVKYLRESVRLRPGSASGLNNLGVALADQRKFDEALEEYYKALAVAPDYTIAWNNIGNAFRSLGRDKEAIQVLDRALQLKPDYAEAYNNLGIAHVALNQHQQALRCYDKSILLRPDYPEAHMNRGLEYLLLGDFPRGWADYEWRWQTKALKSRQFQGRRWDGSSLAGKRILLCYEQGLGDTFQFIRYASELKNRGATVIFEGQSVARQILSRTPGIDEFIPRGERLPPYDCYCPLLSLPGVLQTSLENIPATIPYIFTDPDLIGRWRRRMRGLNGLRVGIAWQGNPQHRGDNRRSTTLANFEALAAVPGVQFISLQRGFGAEQIQARDGKLQLETFAGIEEQSDGFLRTGAIIKNLDLLITVDTGVAHLAAAMGVAVWLLIPPPCDWRWLQDREDSPWYPTLRIFRQRECGDWQELFQRVATALQERVSQQTKRVEELATGAPAETEKLLAEAGRAVSDGQLSQAEKLLKSVLELNPLEARGHHDLGVVYARQRKLSAAISLFRRSIELAPAGAMGYANLGLAFHENDMNEEAIASLWSAIRLGGGTPEVYNNLGVAQSQLGDLRSAESSYLSALRMRPDYADAHYNLARVLLGQGKFEQGWIEHEWRFEALYKHTRDLPTLRWVGESLQGKTIFLHAEQGLGDTIQFVRHAREVKKRGARVIVECQPPLVALLKNCTFIDEVVASGSNLPKFDVHLPLLSLPGILGVELKSIPADVPYLQGDAALNELWKERLGKIEGLKIGIAWQGNPQHRGDRKRSMPLSHFGALARVPGVRLISLQSGFGVEQIAGVRDQFNLTTLDSLGTEGDGFLWTAAIVANLDLVITTDTAVAHLAGAMGVPTWIAISTGCDWRWLSDRDTSPWYPSAKLFRQTRFNEWNTVFAQMADELHRFASSKQYVGSSTSTSSDAGSLHNQGLRLLNQGNAAGAASLLEQTIQLRPESASAHHDLGIALARSGRVAEAIDRFRHALSLDPNLTLVDGNLATALIEKEDFPAAEEHLRRCLEKRPDAFDLHHKLGVALWATQRPREAVEQFEQAIQLRPEYPESHFALARTLRSQDEYPSALKSLQTALQLRPNWPEAVSELGATHSLMNCPRDAAAAYQQLTTLRPNDADAFKNLGVTLVKLGAYEQAASAFHQVVTLRPRSAVDHLNLAIGLLGALQLERGWLEFEWRLRMSSASRRPVSSRRWEGQPLNSRSLLLLAEDDDLFTLQFVRYAKTLKERGARIVLAVGSRIRPLLHDFPHADVIVDLATDLPVCDFHAHIGSCPMLCRTTAQAIPAETPLLIDPSRVEMWSTKLPQRQAKRIGIAWGKEKAAAEQSQALQRLSETPGVSLISLDRGDPGLPPLVHDLPDLRASEAPLVDVASVIPSLDLVVTSDPLTAHLASALARPCIVIMRFSERWRWATGGPTSPWYRSARLLWCEQAVGDAVSLAVDLALTSF